MKGKTRKLTMKIMNHNHIHINNDHQKVQTLKLSTGKKGKNTGRKVMRAMKKVTLVMTKDSSLKMMENYGRRSSMKFILSFNFLWRSFKLSMKRFLSLRNSLKVLVLKRNGISSEEDIQK
jgi:hypothetical protein